MSKKYTVTVIDNETGNIAMVKDKPIQEETDGMLIVWGEEEGIREVGLNLEVWESTEKRTAVIKALFDLANVLCSTPDKEAAASALASYVIFVTDTLEKQLTAEGGAVLCMSMAEELARRAVTEREAKV